MPGKPRLVSKDVFGQETPEGDGALVRRSIGGRQLKMLDPFLLFDDAKVKLPGGFPDHPHRGFETVTYAMTGRFTHEDFSGSKGTMEPGDLQWMTAGRGVLHSEMPDVFEECRGLQLWVNLPAKYKMVPPAYQDMHDKDFPRAHAEGVTVKVIAGSSLGVSSKVNTINPTMYLDFVVQPGASITQPVPEGWNAFVYTLEGNGIFGKEDAPSVAPCHTLVLSTDGDSITAWNKEKSGDLRFLLIGGQPIGEPVAHYGPFVMNTEEELIQTLNDYRQGVNGFEGAPGWKSSNRMMKYMKKQQA